MGDKVNFQTFQSGEDQIGDERELKTIGLGLSTSDALAFHMCGELRIKSIKNLSKQPIATETEFSVLTCTKENRTSFSASVKAFKLERLRNHPSAFLNHSISPYINDSSNLQFSGKFNLVKKMEPG